nr:probable myosin heavy chain ECU04_1000 [Lepeophtheirus salmonis]
MSERHSRASSLSLVSGLGTSSVSGTSESGHVNIDELDDDQLRNAVTGLKDNLKINKMETEIFESYYERLMSGNLSIVNTSSTQSRKTSATQSSSMTPESDSIIQTPSLLDGQRGGRLNRKKSSSRTSLASRHKSMKLSVEQRCGIARKEMAGIEFELKVDRTSSYKKIRNGNYILKERSLRIQELHNGIERQESIFKNGAHDFIKLDESEFTNPKDCFYKLLSSILSHESRLLEKMKTKNSVIQSKILQTSSQIKKRLAIVDEIGTVDHAQLSIENNKYVKDLEFMETELTQDRGDLRKFRQQMDKYLQKRSFNIKMQGTILQKIEYLKNTQASLSSQLKRSKIENDNILNEIKRLQKENDTFGREPSTIDELLSHYLLNEQNEKDIKLFQRKKNLQKLEAMPKGRARSDPPGIQEMESTPYLFKGLTYDLYFCKPDD